VLAGENSQAFGFRIAATGSALPSQQRRLGWAVFILTLGAFLSMKQFSMVVILGLTLMLLALAPQLRADGCDHFNYEHGNTIAATSSWSWNHDMDSHSNAWRDDDDDRRGDGNWGGWGMHVSHTNSGSDADSGSVSVDVSTPEPSSLFLLLSGLVAAAVGFAVKKVAA